LVRFTTEIGGLAQIYSAKSAARCLIQYRAKANKKDAFLLPIVAFIDANHNSVGFFCLGNFFCDLLFIHVKAGKPIAANDLRTPLWQKIIGKTALIFA